MHLKKRLRLSEYARVYLFLFTPAWDSIELTREVDFISHLVVLNPTDLVGAINVALEGSHIHIPTYTDEVCQLHLSYIFPCSLQVK